MSEVFDTTGEALEFHIGALLANGFSVTIFKSEGGYHASAAKDGIVKTSPGVRTNNAMNDVARELDVLRRALKL